MRIANAAHESQPWRIREITPDFTLEDVWALPVEGCAEDFDTLLELMASLDPAGSGSLPTRLLWALRDLLGRVFGLGRTSTTNGRDGREALAKLPIPGTSETSLAERLPEDLSDTIVDRSLDPLPFTPLYRTDVEFASEISNRTVHGVLHLAWVDRGEGRYEGQMAIYVRPRGRLGEAYMALIRPFRYAIVYPALMRQVERAWDARTQPARAAG